MKLPYGLRPSGRTGCRGSERAEQRYVSFRDRLKRITATGAEVLAHNAVQTFRGGEGQLLIRCPSGQHRDRHPSCSVNALTGATLCFACGLRCTDVVALHFVLGRFASMTEALADLEACSGSLPTPTSPWSRPKRAARQKATGKMRPVQRWRYDDHEGRPAFVVIRFQFLLEDGTWELDAESSKPIKEYRPAHPSGRPVGLPEPYRSGTPRPLYQLPNLLATPSERVVYVVEGEPAAEALIRLGWIATTSSGGASGAHRTDWSPLAGRKVVVWPDHDSAGEEFVSEVLGILKGLDPAPIVRRVDVEALNMPPHGDAADWVQEIQRSQENPGGPP